MNEITNCANCGAPLNFLLEENGIVRCGYCGTQYHVNHDGVTPKIDEYYVEFDFMGKKRKFYIGDVEKHEISHNAYRNANGDLVVDRVSSKLKMNLIEL